MVRNGTLDGLRGLAIGLVLLYHYGYCEGISFSSLSIPVVRDIVRCGWMGVVLFFVLSGYFIIGNLIRDKSRLACFRRFFVKRLCRILPIYLLLIFSLAVFGLMWSPDRFAIIHNGSIPMWAYLFFLQNGWTAQSGSFGGHWMGVTWSLAIEVQFYVFVACVVYLCPRRFMGLVMASMVGVSILVRWYILETPGSHLTAMHVLTIARMDSFAVGGCLSMIPLNDKSVSLKGVVGLFSLGVIWFCVLVDVGVVGPFPRLVTAFYYFVLSLGFAGLIYSSLISRCLGWFFSMKALRVLGLWSYFLYLFHIPFLRVVNELVIIWFPRYYEFWGPEMVYLALIGLFGCSVLSYKYIEAPVLNWARDFCKRLG